MAEIKLEELTEELVQELLDHCPCRATKTADGKPATKYTCETPEQREMLAKILEQPSVIEVKRKVITEPPETETAPVTRQV